MEELRLAAKAYYRNSTTEFQDLAAEFFRSMDSNSDGRVSFEEFTRFLSHNGYNWVSTDLFSQLDTNNDGGLDFWEFLTFYYIVKTRNVVCDSCRAQLPGLYFTCIKCFDGGHDTFDLCSRCYSNRNYGHHHSLFLDSYVLLRSKRGVAPGMNVNLACTQPQTSHQTKPNPRFKAMELAVNVAGLALNVGDLALNVGCSIM